MGDLNCSNPMWHCRTANREGITLANYITANNLHVQQQNNNRSTYVPKFNIIDIAICSQSFFEKVLDFKVTKNIGSDHFPTITTIGTDDIIKTKRFYLNWNIFNKKLAHHQNPDREDLTELNFNFRANEVLKRIYEFLPGD